MTTVNLLPFVGSVGRRFTLEIGSLKRPLTVNETNRMHHMAWYKRRDSTKKAWAVVTHDNAVPHLERAVFVVTPLHKDRRVAQDTAACAPEAKAAVDGIVAAGVLDDDDGTHVLAISFLPPEVVGTNGLRITIYEILG